MDQTGKENSKNIINRRKIVMGKMNSPITSNVRNPLKKEDKASLKRKHAEGLSKTGLRPPKSPLG